MITSSEWSSPSPLKGRFAPSPSGRMHAGNIYSALVTWLLCKNSGGQVILRIEDLDPDRCHQAYADQLMRDFEALGLTWDEGPFYQHDRGEVYSEYFQKLHTKNLVYPCFCTRADLKAASAPHRGEHWVYAGTCRNLSSEQLHAAYQSLSSQNRPGPSWRVKIASNDIEIEFDDIICGPQQGGLSSSAGDFVVRRADSVFAYQLAVVVDDAEQGVTFVSRGNDLLASAFQQRYLQQVLELPFVTYAHFPLLCAPDGKRLAKRDLDASLAEMLDLYGSPAAVLGHIAAVAGIIPEEQPILPEEILASVSSAELIQALQHVQAIPWK